LTNCELLVEISDDGRGINTDKVIVKAIQRGVISSDRIKEMSELEVVSLIFNPGFSTCDNVTNISGRGMGMSVVKSSVEESLKGTVQLTTSKYQGLRTVLKIPV
jgi:two-component system chemotaxis sensor kinase CheA